MKLLLAFATSVALLAAAPYAANAGEQTVIRDSGGRTIGTATTSGNQTTFRDAGGRTSLRTQRSPLQSFDQLDCPTVSAITAPRSPRGLSRPVVESRAV